MILPVSKFSEAASKVDPAVEQLLRPSTKEKDDKDLCKLKEALGAILSSKNVVKSQFAKSDKNTVKFITSEDVASKAIRSLVVSMNEENLVEMIEVEMLVGKKVLASSSSRGKARGGRIHWWCHWLG